MADENSNELSGRDALIRKFYGTQSLVAVKPLPTVYDNPWELEFISRRDDLQESPSAAVGVWSKSHGGRGTLVVAMDRVDYKVLGVLRMDIRVKENTKDVDWLCSIVEGE